MENDPRNKLVGRPEVMKLSAGDPLFERVQELNELIARRAHELFTLNGSIHGRDTEHWLRAESEVVYPMPLDVVETESGFIVRAEVPGFSEKDLDIRVESNRLFIMGKREETAEETKAKVLYSERTSRQLFRMVELPTNVDTNEVKATLNAGLLEINLAKVAPAKKIAIARAASA